MAKKNTAKKVTKKKSNDNGEAEQNLMAKHISAMFAEGQKKKLDIGYLEYITFIVIGDGIYGEDK